MSFQLQLQQLALQLGGGHTSTRLQGVQAAHVKPQCQQQRMIGWAFVGLLQRIVRLSVRRRGMFGPLAGRNPELFKHILRRLHQLGTLLDQRVAAPRLR